METVGNWLNDHSVQVGGQPLSKKDILILGSYASLSALFFKYAPLPTSSFTSGLTFGLAGANLLSIARAALQKSTKEKRQASFRSSVFIFKALAAIRLGELCLSIGSSSLSFITALRSLEPLSCGYPLLLLIRTLSCFSSPRLLLYVASLLEANTEALCDHLDKHSLKPTYKNAKLWVVASINNRLASMPALANYLDIVPEKALEEEKEWRQYLSAEACEFAASSRVGSLLFNHPAVQTRLTENEKFTFSPAQNSGAFNTPSHPIAHPKSTSDHIFNHIQKRLTDQASLARLQALNADPQNSLFSSSFISYVGWLWGDQQPPRGHLLSSALFYTTYLGIAGLAASKQPRYFTFGVVIQIASQLLPLLGVLSMASWFFVYTPDCVRSFGDHSLLHKLFFLVWIPTYFHSTGKMRVDGFLGGYFATESMRLAISDLFQQKKSLP